MRTIKRNHSTVPLKSSSWKRMLIVLGLILAIIFGNMIYIAVSDQSVSAKISLPEFDTLFTKEARNKLQINRTLKTRNREPVSTYVYDNKFQVIVIKVRLLHNLSLHQILNLKNETSNQRMNAVYSSLPSNNSMTINLKAGKEIMASTVHFDFNGGIMNTVMESGNVYCYSYSFDSFSIRYDDEPYDIVATGDKKLSQIQTAFIKKDKSLYIILLNADDPKIQMEPNLLYSMIKK
ncbi:hypothetical protein FO440_00330 [Mucilaginibacter corticis]|uniref:Uncharacterized protein n=1 Tax=Mucilaginibacter corticis TaxID=2597670 RepID=A0A556MRZ2_9SPHI|nr:hypothetical protein [Mucilaginibacter corticis]TSJ42673.1 hypothetical protein FO440_00330 [Mucilaginibacter corticis]